MKGLSMNEEGHRLDSLAGIWPMSNSAQKAQKVNIFCAPKSHPKPPEFLLRSCCYLIYS